MIVASFVAHFPAFGYRNFRLYTLGQVLNLAGSRVQEVAAGWLVWELTHSAAWVGALALAELGPRLLLWPFAGSIADRFDRRKLAIAFHSLSIVEALCLAVLSGVGLVSVPVLFVFIALLGINTAFWQPVRLAILPSLVARDALPSAVALASVTANLARVLGPLVAGPVLIWGSTTLAFSLNAVSFAAVLLAFCLMRLPPTSHLVVPAGIAPTKFFRGFSTITDDPGVRSLILFVAIFAICVRPVADLIPAFSEAIFGAGPGGIALLTAALGLGSLFAGLFVSARRNVGGLTGILAAAGALGSLATIAFALAPTLTLALFFMGVVGFGITLKNIVAQILLQTALNDAIQGRVLSLYGAVFSSAPAIGAVAIGWCADRFGMSAPVILGSAVGLGASLFIYVHRQRLASSLLPSREDRRQS